MVLADFTAVPSSGGASARGSARGSDLSTRLPTHFRLQIPAPGSAPPATSAAPPAMTPGSTFTEAQIQAVVDGGIKLVVWDFDKTIMAIHSIGQRITPGAVLGGLRDLNADFTDLPFFTRIVRRLVDRGVGVAIASFGRYDVIQAYMDLAFGVVAPGGGASAPLDADDPPPPRYFTRDNVSTPSVVGGMDGYVPRAGKTAQLIELAKAAGIEPHQMLFFDGA